MSNVDEVQNHYKTHLSKFYSWMFGDFGSMVARQKGLFEDLKIYPGENKIAFDLGSGPGFQSIALSQLGFKVHAVDFSEELLNELRLKDPSIDVHAGDLRELGFAKALKPGVIVCMGDTLTHLLSKEEVSKLVKEIHTLLVSGGRVIFTYRDLSQERVGTERFIPVRADDQRILTCFLENDDEHVKVFDLLYEKIGGDWVLSKSFYRKVKLPSAWLIKEMEKAGFSVQSSKLQNGMDLLIGLKR